MLNIGCLPTVRPGLQVSSCSRTLIVWIAIRRRRWPAFLRICIVLQDSAECSRRYNRRFDDNRRAFGIRGCILYSLGPFASVRLWLFFRRMFNIGCLPIVGPGLQVFSYSETLIVWIATRSRRSPVFLRTYIVLEGSAGCSGRYNRRFNDNRRAFGIRDCIFYSW